MQKILKKMFKNDAMNESEIKESLLQITKRDSSEDLSAIALYMKKKCKTTKA